MGQFRKFEVVRCSKPHEERKMKKRSAGRLAIWAMTILGLTVVIRGWIFHASQQTQPFACRTTVTGTVSYSMFGALKVKILTECTRQCVQQGQRYHETGRQS